MKARIQNYVERIKRMPNKGVRVTIGVLLIVGGILGALPILGFWMAPLGLAILSVDYAWARRATNKLKQWLVSIRGEFGKSRWGWLRRIKNAFRRRKPDKNDADADG